MEWLENRVATHFGVTPVWSMRALSQASKLPQNFGLWWGPMKAFCHSVNVDGVVVLFAGGGNTSTLYVVIKIFVITGGGDPKT